MKKFLLLISTLLLTLALVACGSNSDSSKDDKNSNTENTKQEESKDSKAKENAENKDEVYESELGKLTVVNKKKGINKVVKSGPMNLTINAIQIGNLEVAEDFRDTFDGKEKITAITVEMKVENTSEDTISFYPDQATLTTNTGNQVEADLSFSDNVGGDFYGKVNKEGNVVFFVDSPAEEIKNIKLIIDGAVNENLDSLSDQLKIELSF